MNNGFFTDNRWRLIDVLGDELVVLAGWTSMQWHGDTAVPFRQESNFWYLTGIEHADWRCIIDGEQAKSWLIAPEVDASHQLFDGSLSFDDAKNISGVDEVLDQKSGQRLLKNLAKKYSAVYILGELPYAEHVDFVLNPATDNLREELGQVFDEMKDCRATLAKLRAIKQPEEIAIMKHAASLSVEAFGIAKNKLSSCKYEYEIEAELAYHFRRHNATHAFEPIVASGKNACTLHYIHNSSTLQPGGMVLIDAGANLGGYPADITRTYAVGAVSERQAAVHLAVQAAEQKIIELIRPGFSIKNYLESVDDIMKEALLSLGLMKNSKDEKSYRRYFPHAISHGLGLDVHESLGGYKELRPGMMLTVEPGIYIPEEKIGVRIENDILVTENGHRNITGSLSTDL